MYDDLIVAATAKHGLPVGLLSALIQHESNDDPNAVGDNGLARGLGQMHAAACATVGAGLAIATIDQSTATSSGTTVQLLPFRITGLYPGVGNGSDPTTAYNWAVVGFNFQLFRSNTHG